MSVYPRFESSARDLMSRYAQDVRLIRRTVGPGPSPTITEAEPVELAAVVSGVPASLQDDQVMTTDMLVTSAIVPGVPDPVPGDLVEVRGRRLRIVADRSVPAGRPVIWRWVVRS